MNDADARIRTSLANWRKALKPEPKLGIPKYGTILAMLVVFDRIVEDPDGSIDIGAHLTPERGQVKGLGAGATNRVLEKLGEQRRVDGEGGRTSRGILGVVTDLLVALDGAGWHELAVEARHSIAIDARADMLVAFQTYHAAQRLEFEWAPTATLESNIERMLVVARDAGKEGTVAQHLVGSMLELCADETVPTHKAAAADVPTGRDGDFAVGRTTIHVTTAPGAPVIEKCRRNIVEGEFPMLLVRADRVAIARGLAEIQGISDGLAVRSLNDWCASAIEVRTGYDLAARWRFVATWLDTYNKRVSVEGDPSLLVKHPRALTRLVETSSASRRVE